MVLWFLVPEADDSLFALVLVSLNFGFGRGGAVCGGQLEEGEGARLREGGGGNDRVPDYGL